MTNEIKTKIIHSFFYFLILMSLFCIVSVIADTTQANSEMKKLTFDDFGKEIMNKPGAPITGSNIEKAKYAYEMYCNTLSEARAGVNNDWVDRFSFLFTTTGYNDCNTHFENFKKIFSGMGVQDSEWVMIQGDKGGLPVVYDPILGVKGDVNNNHGAMVIFDENGEPFVLDPWMHATTQEEEYEKSLSGILSKTMKYTGNLAFSDVNKPTLYSGAKDNPFNCMPLKEWIERMNKRGYVNFSGGRGALSDCPKEDVLSCIKAKYKKPTISTLDSWNFVPEVTSRYDTSNDRWEFDVILTLVDSEINKHEIYDYYWALISYPENYKGLKSGPWGDQDRCTITSMGKMVEGKYELKAYKIQTQNCDGKQWQDPENTRPDPEKMSSSVLPCKPVSTKSRSVLELKPPKK